MIKTNYIWIVLHMLFHTDKNVKIKQNQKVLDMC